MKQIRSGWRANRPLKRQTEDRQRALFRTRECGSFQRGSVVCVPVGQELRKPLDEKCACMAGRTVLDAADRLVAVAPIELRCLETK